MDPESRAGQTLRIMFEESPIAMCATLVDGFVVRKNPAFEALAGNAHSVLDLVRARDRKALAQTLENITSGVERSARLEFELALLTNRWCEISAVAMRGGSGDVMLHIVDITERRRRESELRELAERDQLTGLFNRSSFNRVLVDRLVDNPTGCLLYLDLDGFKEVNDSRGHQRGDEVLIAVSRAIEEAVTDRGIVARLGGDEFGILLDADMPAAAVLGDALIRRISLTAAILGNPRIAASVGLTRLRPGCDLETVIAEVDRAMYAAKRSGKGRCVQASLTPGRRTHTA